MSSEHNGYSNPQSQTLTPQFPNLGSQPWFQPRHCALPTSSLFSPAVQCHYRQILVLFTVPCAVGTYYHEQSRACEPCPLGSYQSESGQLQCSVCPLIAGRQGVTIAPGARSANDCKGMCISLWLEEYTMAEAVSHRLLTMEAPGLIPGQSSWGLWWTQWWWDRFFSDYFSFPVSLSFQQCSIYFICLLPVPCNLSNWQHHK